MFLTIFSTVLAPLLLVVGAAYALGRASRLDPAALARVTFYIFNPCLVFVNLAATTIAPELLGRLALLKLLFYALMVPAVYLLAGRLKLTGQVRSALLLSVVFANSGNFGLPVNEFAFGKEAVALALNEQYMPRFAGDALPGQLVSCAVAIADKLDSLVGIFGIGQAPKGDKDPFALRRAAIGALRIMVEKQLPLDLLDVIGFAQTTFGDKLSNAQVADEVLDFMLGRFRAWYEAEGYGIDVIQAVLARRPTNPADFDRRVKAVAEFRKLDAALALAAANKRVANILAKVTEAIPATVDAGLLTEAAEKALHTAIVAEQAYQQSQNSYSEGLAHLAQLRDVVDQFFDQVMVNADDAKVRLNRQALLAQLRALFLQVADIAVLQ